MKKKVQHILTAALLALGTASAASAATVDVYITGSSAFRGAVTNAIANLLTTPQGAFEASASGSNSGPDTTNAIASASQQLIYGVPNANGTAAGLNSGNTYYFHTCWTGSLGGLASLAYNVAPTKPTGPSGSATSYPYLPDSVPTALVTPSTGAAGTLPNGGESLGSDYTASTAFPTGGRKADGAFSDIFQTSTNLQAVTLTAATVTAPGASPSNTDGIVGVVPFVFVANPDLSNFKTGGSTGPAIGSSYTYDNLTATNAKELYSGGLDVAQLTGNSVDNNNSVGFVVATGRDANSGTRFITFAETGFNPPGQTSEPTQFAVSTSGNNILVDKFPGVNLFPGTAAEQDFTSGQSGYTSGLNERNALAISGTSGTSSDNPSYVIGSLGESDAIAIMKTSPGASYMAYNGVAYTTSGLAPTTNSTNPFNRTLVDQGLYTFWGYEHAYLDPATSQAAAINAVAYRVRNYEAPIAGEAISNMAVQRSVEGGPISYVGVGGSTE